MSETANPEAGAEITDQDTAVAAVSKMLESPSDEATQPESPEAEVVSVDEAEGETPEAVEAEPVEAEAEPLTEATIEDIAEAFDVDASELSSALRVKVKVDGKEQSLSLQEALSGYQRDADYRQKTQTLSETRKAHEAEVAKFQQEREQGLARLNEVVKALEAQVNDSGITEERLQQLVMNGETDEYIRLRHVKDMQERNLEQAKATADEEQNRLNQERNAEVQQWRETQVEALQNAMPELRDPAKANKFAEDISEVMKEKGYSQEEVDSWMQLYDHRQALFLADAIELRQLKAGKKQLKKQLKVKPKVMKPGLKLSKRQSSNDDFKAAQNNMIKAAKNSNLSKSDVDAIAARRVAMAIRG